MKSHARTTNGGRIVAGLSVFGVILACAAPAFACSSYSGLASLIFGFFALGFLGLIVLARNVVAIAAGERPSGFWLVAGLGVPLLLLPVAGFVPLILVGGVLLFVVTVASMFAGRGSA